MNGKCVNGLGKALLVCLFLASTALATYGQIPVKELVLYLPLDSTGQSQIRDFSDKHNNGTATAIVVSNSPSLVSMQQTRQLTFAVWIKPNSIPREFPVILSKGGNQSPGAYGGYEFLLNADDDSDFRFESGSCDIVTYNADGRWINNHVGEWIHVAFTINDQTKTAKFYVNGQPTNDEFDYGTYFSSGTELNFNVPNNLYIGTPDPASNANRAKFDGSMRELMLFNRALTAKEIQNIYRLTKSPKTRIVF